MAPRITASGLGQRQSCGGACIYLFILYTAFPVMKQNCEHWPQVWWTRCGSDGGKVNILPESDLWGSSVIYRKLWCAAAVVRANFYNNTERRALWSHPSPQQKKDWHLTETVSVRVSLHWWEWLIIYRPWSFPASVTNLLSNSNSILNLCSVDVFPTISWT